MAFDFPASPVEGQVYSPGGRESYTYLNSVWRSGVYNPVPEAPIGGTTRYVRQSGVWTSIGPGTVDVAVVTGGVSVVFAVPPDARICYLRGFLRTSVPACNLLIRVSKDNLASWVSGSGDYVFNQIYATGTTVACATTQTSYGLITNSSNLASLMPRMISAYLFFPPDSGEQLQYITRSAGYANAPYHALFAGYTGPGGPFTHFYVGVEIAATFTGKLIAEWDA